MVKVVGFDFPDHFEQCSLAFQRAWVEGQPVHHRRNSSQLDMGCFQRRSPYQSMYRKAIFQKAFRQVGAVLAGDSRNQRAWHDCCSFTLPPLAVCSIQGQYGCKIGLCIRQIYPTPNGWRWEINKISLISTSLGCPRISKEF